MSGNVPAEADDNYAVNSASNWLEAHRAAELAAIKTFVIDPVLKITGYQVPPPIVATSGMIRVSGTTHKQLYEIAAGVENLLGSMQLIVTQAALVVSKLNEARPPFSPMDVRELIDVLSQRGRLPDFLRLAHPDHGKDFKNWLIAHGVDWDYVLMHYDSQAKDSIDFFAGFMLGAACSIATMKIFEALFKVGTVAIGAGLKWFSALRASERVVIVATTGVVITDRVTPAQICEIVSTIAKSAIPMLKQAANTWVKEFDDAIYSLEFFKAGLKLGEAVPQVLDLVGLLNGTLHLTADIVEKAVIQISKRVRQIEWDAFLKMLALDNSTFEKLRVLIESAEYGELVTVNSVTLQKASDEIGTIVLATSNDGKILGSARVPSGSNAVRIIVKNSAPDPNANLMKSTAGNSGSAKAAAKISLPRYSPIINRFERFISELESLIKVNSGGLSKPWATLRTRTIDPNAVKAIREVLERVATDERAEFLSDLSSHVSSSFHELRGKVNPWNVLVAESAEHNKKALVALVGRTPKLMSSSAPSREVLRQAWSQLNEITMDAHHFIESSMFKRFAKHFKRIATKDVWTSEETMLAIAIPTQSHQRSIEATIRRLSQGSVPDEEVIKAAGLWLEEGRVAGDAAIEAAGSITNLFDITAPLQRIVRVKGDIPSTKIAITLKEVSEGRPFLLVNGSLTAEALADTLRPPAGLTAAARAKFLKKFANGESLKFVVDPTSPYGLVDLCDAYSAAYNILWGGGTVKNVNVSGLADILLPQIAAIRKAATEVVGKMGF